MDRGETADVGRTGSGEMVMTARKARREESDRRMLKAAVALIAEHGTVGASLADIGVNAIAIEASEPDLTAYFFENVIMGEGAFVETALRFEDYPDRIRKKLLREVSQQNAALVPPVRP